jgi:hypothetical protein
VPPVTATVALPLLPPKHSTLTLALMLEASKGGWVIVTLAVSVHPLASVTVIV